MRAALSVRTNTRHAELVSASTLQSATECREDGWTLKQVQGDESSFAYSGEDLS